ncbi:hypothetical protein GUJ93_ZPchr0010g8381 [Zizania palustris]|uniref:Uncharacterized protein n=1 Tax=Zizania palustris TaxID=103762 RepID=A0A8J5SZ59_ZIZPA|nr:hypothetical protein GUJ93_ZPchr0010g8381 [Zizania palustris]
MGCRRKSTASLKRNPNHHRQGLPSVDGDVLDLAYLHHRPGRGQHRWGLEGVGRRGLEGAGRQAWPSGGVGATRRRAFAGLAGQNRLAMGPACAAAAFFPTADASFPPATATAPFLLSR